MHPQRNVRRTTAGIVAALLLSILVVGGVIERLFGAGILLAVGAVAVVGGIGWLLFR